jgi:Peptidase family M1 domain
VTTRKIRQPIASDDDIANAFDDITWQKGAAVIRMFENWPGAAKFRAGVQQYLQENADGNATVTQFVSAVGQDVAPAFSTYLDQAGAPVVSMELECGTGGRKSRSHRSDMPIESKRKRGSKLANPGLRQGRSGWRRTFVLRKPFEFVKANLEAIVAKSPREVGADFATSLASVGGGFCDAAGHAQVDEFFSRPCEGLYGRSSPFGADPGDHRCVWSGLGEGRTRACAVPVKLLRRRGLGALDAADQNF